MFFVKKRENTPTEFEEAVRELNNDYHALQKEAREAVVNLLFSEQGGLCPLCERKKEKFAPTIEHFHPLSIFPHLQLNYHNLYVSCQTCNSPKANHLVPAYIFDPRFNPYDTNSVYSQQKIIYTLEDGKVYVRVPLASSTKGKPITSEHYNAYITQSTLDLMRQNRYNPTENNGYAENSLLIQRAAIWHILMPQIRDLSQEVLEAKYRNYKNTLEYPEFVSLIAFLFQREFKRRNVPLPS